MWHYQNHNNDNDNSNNNNKNEERNYYNGKCNDDNFENDKIDSSPEGAATCLSRSGVTFALSNEVQNISLSFTGSLKKYK